MNPSTESLKTFKAQQESSTLFRPTLNPRKIRPILENPKAGVFNREMLNQLLKAHIKYLSWMGSTKGKISKRKTYQKQGSVGRMSKFLSEFWLNPLEPAKLKLGHLFQLTKNLRRLRNTNLGLNFNTFQRDLAFKKMVHSFKVLKDLTFLHLNFIMWEDTTGQLLKILMTRIQSLKRLQALKLDLFTCSAQGLKYLSQGLSRLNNLLSLHLSFRNDQKVMEDSHRDQLLSAIGKLKNLSGLSLSFIRCSKITSDHLYSVAACLKKLNSLTKFTLALDNCQELTDEGLKGLSQGLESLKLLSVLKLDFRLCNQFKDLGIAYLGERLKNSKYLASLDLILEDCSNIGDQGLCDLFNQLKNCKMLKRIVFNMKKNVKIGDASLRALSFLLKELKELTHIDLEFSSSFTNFTEEGFENLFETFKSFNNLNFFTLNFSECDGLRDKNLMTLASNIKTWTSSTDTILNFKSCPNLTDDGIKAFCIALQDVRGLSAVRLFFQPGAEAIENERKTLLKKLECEEVLYNTLYLKSSTVKIF